MTPRDVINRVRNVTQDEDGTRDTNDELLLWVNDGMQTAAKLLPQFFTTTGTHTCTAGALQTVVQDRLVKLVAQPMLHATGAALMADRDSMDAFMPTWRLADAGNAQNWFPRPEDDKFDVYPPAAGGESLTVPFVQAPADFTIDATLPIPDVYRPALVAYVVGRSESKDDEHVNSNRAAQAMAEALAQMTG